MLKKDAVAWNNKPVKSTTYTSTPDDGRRNMMFIANPGDVLCSEGVGFSTELYGANVGMDNPRHHRTCCVGRGCVAYVESKLYDGTTRPIWKCGALHDGAWFAFDKYYDE